MSVRLPLLLAISLLTGTVFAADAPLLHPMFQDHGVLQRERPIPVWGNAKPGEVVTVTLGRATVTAKAGKDGAWRADLPAQAAGGPVILTAKTGTAQQVAADLLVGDVYLCSGQSNMEMQVARSLDSWTETNRAKHPNIRYLSVNRATNTGPQRDFTHPVRWHAVTPDTVGDMSAVCYFFGREMRQIVDVPVGLINSSWGGSTIESWMDTADLAKTGLYAQDLAILSAYDKDRHAGIRKYFDVWEGWWKTKGQGEPWRTVPAAGDGWRAVPSLTSFVTWGVPELNPYVGIVWYRNTFTLTEAQAKQGGTLLLGSADDYDVSWVNDVPAGSLYGPGDPRRYPLPARTLKPGINQVTIAVINGYGDGGLYGSADEQAILLADGTRVPIDGGWQYKVTPGEIGTAPHAPWGTVDGLSTIRNAMVAPMGPYAVRAALWYQGESNTAKAPEYQSLLAGLMSGWRRQFGADLPFLVVQLPEYGYPQDKPIESGWARLRESQRMAVAADPHAAMAVTNGLGDWYDVHPANKQQVAKRLTRAARHLLMGEKISASGPVPVDAQRQGDVVRIRFTDIDGKLKALNHHRPIGFELCGDGWDSCRFVDASLSGDIVTLPIGDGPAIRVRYCWAESGMCNLYDDARLPAGQFEIPVR